MIIPGVVPMQGTRGVIEVVSVLPSMRQHDAAQNRLEAMMGRIPLVGEQARVIGQYAESPHRGVAAA